MQPLYVERYVVCFVLVTSFLRILPTILSLSPLVLFSVCPLSLSLSLFFFPFFSTITTTSIFLFLSLQPLYLFIISRRKLHLATVQLFPFISFVMHREARNWHKQWFPSLCLPRLLISPPRRRPLRAFYSFIRWLFPYYHPLVTRGCWSLCDDKWTIKATTEENPTENFPPTTALRLGDHLTPPSRELRQTPTSTVFTILPVGEHFRVLHLDWDASTDEILRFFFFFFFFEIYLIFRYHLPPVSMPTQLFPTPNNSLKKDTLLISNNFFFKYWVFSKLKFPRKF